MLRLRGRYHIAYAAWTVDLAIADYPARRGGGGVNLRYKVEDYEEASC